jgi:hypothetical protein
MPTTHVITADVARDENGLAIAGSTGSVWIATDAAGNQLYRGRTPYCGAARALIAQGADPDDILQGMTPEGMKTLVGKVGVFARLTVAQRDPVRIPGGNRGTYREEHFVPYEPYVGKDT